MQHRAKFLRCLTGYIDTANAVICKVNVRPIANRPIDIVYRAAHLPYWFGSHGQLKHEIATIVDQRARQLGLTCDISTRDQDAITGNHWFDFLASGKVIIGCESGSSVLDRRGQIQLQIRNWLSAHPGLSFDEIRNKLPSGWDDYQFFALGPRHLEAIVTRTCQVLVEGEFDGVLQSKRHYLPLRRDFGNLDEVLHMAKDHSLLQSTADRAFEEIFESRKHTYEQFASVLDIEIAKAHPQRHIVPWSLVAPWHASGNFVRRFMRPIADIGRRLHPRHWPGLGIRRILRGA